VDLQEGPHGPQEPLMPQKQGCHLTLYVPTDRHCMLSVQRRRGTGLPCHPVYTHRQTLPAEGLKKERNRTAHAPKTSSVSSFVFFFGVLFKVQPRRAFDPPCLVMYAGCFGGNQKRALAAP